jgi:cell pole-organizing protein PopZ
MSDTKSQQEPSMEEILASIRRIISEDNEPEASAPEPAPPKTAREPVPAPAEDPEFPEQMDEDVLELTQMVRDDGSVVDLRDDDDDVRQHGWNDEPEPEPEPQIDMDNLDDFFDRPSEPPPRVDPAPQPASAARVYEDDDLVSAPTAAATSAAFAHLASSLGGAGTAVYAGGPTVEDIVKELLRPMLRSWLDENLPPTVERLVQREIEKMVRRAQGG